MQETIFEVLELSDISTRALENGQVIHLPKHGFSLKNQEQLLLNENLLAPGKKNISFNPRTQQLNHLHARYQKSEIEHQSFELMSRFFNYAKSLLETLFPSYQNHLNYGRTSYRPVEIKGRQTSILKDDTRLHVDAFNATPVAGQRILRVFANIHPNHQARVWNLGEPFAQVLEYFKAEIPPYSSWKATLLQMMKLTKSRRTAYDHFMLQLHDRMKRSQNYQTRVNKTTFHFPANSSWIVFTDQVSHAALSGQYLLEQTFYLPVTAMSHPETSPLYQWQTLKPEMKML